MSEVNRYSIISHTGHESETVEDSEGPLVEYDDYAALKAQLEEATASADSWKAASMSIGERVDKLEPQVLETRALADKTIVTLKTQLEEANKLIIRNDQGEKWLASKLCEIMAMTVSGFADAAIVTDGPFDANTTLACVKQLRDHAIALKTQRDRMRDALEGIKQESSDGDDPYVILTRVERIINAALASVEPSEPKDSTLPTPPTLVKEDGK